MFMAAQFTPDGIQILTCGTDRKVGYWETLDCSLVREIEGSSVGTLNCIDISPDGQCFITGSNDCTVKVWEYNTGNLTHIGVAHAAIITGCKFSPNGEKLVTTSADGAIVIWKYNRLKIPNEPAVQTDRVSNSTYRTPKLDNEECNELSSQIAEVGEVVRADRTVRSDEKSVSSCASKHDMYSDTYKTIQFYHFT